MHVCVRASCLTQPSLPLSLPQIGALEQQVEDFSQKLKSAELLLAESEAHTQTLVEH